MVHSSQKDSYDMLTDLLLEADRLENSELKKKVEKIHKTLFEKKKLAGKVDPIIDRKLELLKEKFPEYIGPQITRSIQKQIQESQSEVVEALYPIIGSLVKRYITAEFRKITEQIDEQLKNAFSVKRWKLRIRSWFSNVKQKDLILADLANCKILAIYFIDSDSGLPLVQSSNSELIDSEVLTGMLTAIKMFAEDALAKKTDKLEIIDYGDHQILLINFHKYYCAYVIWGIVSEKKKSILTDLAMNFAIEHLKNINEIITQNASPTAFSQLDKLIQNFNGENQ